MDDEIEIREVETSEAEAVLTVCVFVAAMNRTTEYKIPLARVHLDPPEVTVSETTLPDGSVIQTTKTVRRGVTTGRGEGGISGWRTPVDQREEHSLHVSVSGLSADVVEVSCSADWTVPVEISGNFKEVLIVRWLGSARADLPDGSWVTAEMTTAPVPMRDSGLTI